MTRTINAATITALQSDSIRMADLYQFDFTTVIRITNWGRDITALSETWDSSAHIINSTEAVETSELQINAMTIDLSAVEQTYVSLFLGNDYHDIRVRKWKAILDSSDAVVGDPILVFDGRIDEMGIDDTQGSPVVQVSVASHWSNFDEVRGRKTNHNSQQIFFAGDLGFEFAADTKKDIKWGRG